MRSINKTYRIAAASTDGKTINEHFGKASSFLIYDIGKESRTFVEKRGVMPLNCESEHTEESLASNIEALRDCTAVVVVKIGGPVKRAFEINGISIFEKTDTIDNALNKLAAYYVKTGGE
jgi:predicted Fe-Mo cluster-binding NifX family protein